MLPTFTTHIYQLIPHLEEKKIYVAVSGGIDSMVLLNLCHQASLSPTALHCNFNLRGEDSKADEDFVKSYCESLNIDFKSTHFQTSEIAKKHRLSIQECARNLRYNWFQTFLENDKNAVLLTGHHQNDSIETFFINLLRGTGLKGLTGIKVSREQIHRPLLAFRKNDLVQYATKHQISFREDLSNADTKYTRNKIRHQVIPLLKEFAPQLETKLTTLMDELNSTHQFLEDYTEKLRPKIVLNTDNLDKILISDLKELPVPVQIKFFNRYHIQRHQLGEITKLLDSKTGATFKNDFYVFLKNRHQLIIQKNIDQSNLSIQVTDFSRQIKIANQTFNFTIVEYSNVKFATNTAYIDFEKIEGPITITNQHSGLRIQPLGMTGSKLVSDILTEAKLNHFEKAQQLVLLHKSDTIWVVGKTINQKYSLNNKSKSVLKIEMLE